ncbi:MAG TPA: aminomethyl-transferring glycine dehydrogenase subunit GcvPB [Candidatus Krumholzibacteria bacterium]|nr:aminomethyl-transferring glycine dehydrogenase subunit GcvPB [Candidatus Krumholzibacteria bacterium]
MSHDFSGTIYGRSRPGRHGYHIASQPSAPPRDIPAEYLREGRIGLPEVSEPQVMRHYVELSTLNHHVDKDLFPLGSCTMKYNPKVNEDVASMVGFGGLHPEQSAADVQGALRVMHALEQQLAAISGMDAVTLQPAAGAQGEMTGLLLARAYFASRGEARRKVLVPDSAHGTNPATATVTGFETHTFRSGKDGRVDMGVLESVLDDDVAVLMLTVPNTLGLFETHIAEIVEAVHRKGGLCYMDGANMNALMGQARPGDFGFDMMHYNLHKTFSTPHGGGGPGSGPVAVKSHLEPFLPTPRVVQRDGEFHLDYNRPHTIGALHSFFGNFGIYLRAYTYITRLGADGIRRASSTAILNANYLAKRIAAAYPIPYGERCMHEFVATGEPLKKHGVRTLDVAKRLLDFGFYAPTVYFPLTVPEALMVEPTETESKETLDRFADTLLEIAREAVASPEVLTSAPTRTPVRRVDETTANRNPVVTVPMDA